MSLTLFMHPLSSYCHKVLIALYETEVPFERRMVDGDGMRELRKLWPLGKFPVLRDEGRNQLVPETSIIIEYLALHYPGEPRLIPHDPDLAREVRMHDRFFDNYLHTPMQKVPGDRLRPEKARDPYGVEEARSDYRRALDMVERLIDDRTWVMGETFTMADCAAAPALYFGELFFGPFRQSHPNASAYLERMKTRPSYARVLHEARPYLHLIPR